MPGKKDDPNYPITNTPDAKTGLGDQNVPVTGVDGKTTSLTDAPGKQLFGDGQQPPALPANAAGVSGDPVSKTQAAQAAADQAMSGSANGPGLPRNNALAASQANNATTTTTTNADNPLHDARVPGTLTRTRIAQATAPHYFSEQTDNVFIPDFLIYICGANVTPHVKGTLQWSYGLDNTPNTCSFTLDNSNDKFTITPENIVYNHFHAGVTSNPVGEFDDSAKAKIWLYKNNELPLPHGPGTFRPNTLPEDDAGGRRLPLNLFGSIFHKMDPIRVWIRVGAYDEWLPAFTGYVQRHTYTDGWVDMNREVQIQAACIRDVMRKMRVQRNSIRYNMPGTTTVSEAYEPPTQGHEFETNTPNADNLKTTEKIDNNSFFQSIIRGGDMYAFAWAQMSFKQLTEYMTIGGMAPSEHKHADTADDKDVYKDGKIKTLKTEIQDTEAAIAAHKKEIDAFNPLQHLDNLQKLYNEKQAQLTALGVKIDENPNQLATPTQLFEREALNKDVGDILSEKRNYYAGQNQKAIDDLQGKLSKLRADLADVEKNFHTSVHGEEPVQGIGRMTMGEQLRYPVKPGLDPASLRQNADQLDKWYRICTFGSPVRSLKPNVAKGSAREIHTGMDEKPDMSSQNVRYWTLDEIANPKTGAGVRCRWDDLWAPDNQLVHWLLPPSGQSGAESTNITDNTLNLTVKGVRSWVTRNELIQEFATMVDYRWWVTGVGDIVFEFPMYDFEPQDFGPWSDVLTVDYHAISCTLDEEAGDVPTAVRAVGTITGNANVDTSDTEAFKPPPNGLIYSPNMISRLGLTIKIINYPFLKDEVLLHKLAIAQFQKLALEAENSSVELGWRPWITPNRPIKLVPRDRISLTGTVSHSMTVFGACATTLETGFTRQIDTTGLRRYMTGGAHQPLSFGLIGGATNLTASSTARVKTSQDNIRFFAKNINNPSALKERLDDNVLEDTRNHTDKFPDGYDRYNVADFGSFDSTGADASRQAQQDAREAAGAAFTAKQDASSAALTGAAHVLAGGAITGTSGFISAKDPPPSATQGAGAKPSISIGTGPSVDGLSSIGSDDAKQLKNGLGTVGNFSSIDIFNLGAVIASQTRGKDVSPAVKIAIGWTVLNGAGAKSNLKNLKPNSISGAAASSHPQWVDSTSTDIARSILAGDTADPTGGATGFASYDPNVPYDDPRVCNALTGELVSVTPGATMTSTGQPVADIGKFVFFKRNAKHEAAVHAGDQERNVHLPKPFDEIEDDILEAAGKSKINAAILCGLIKHENGGQFGSLGAKLDIAGGLGAGLGWDNFEPALFENAHRMLTGNNALIREHYPSADGLRGHPLSRGTSGTLWGVLHRASESDQYPSIFVRTKAVPASTTKVAGSLVGNVNKAEFFAGSWSDVYAAAKSGKDPTDLLRPYNFEVDPLALILATPRVNILTLAGLLATWLQVASGQEYNRQTVVDGLYGDMDLYGKSINSYYMAIYGMSNFAQVRVLLNLASTYNVEPVDFYNGIPVPITSKSTTGGLHLDAGSVAIVGGMAQHGDHSSRDGVHGFAEFVLKEAHDTFWPTIKILMGASTSLVHKCQTGDPQAISELEKRFQNGKTLKQLLDDLHSKSGA